MRFRNNYSRQMLVLVSLVVVAVFDFSIVNSQGKLPERCKILSTSYTRLASDFRWIDANQVVFTVDTGLTGAAIGVNQKQQYLYQPIEDKLTPVSDVMAIASRMNIAAESGAQLGISDEASARIFVYKAANSRKFIFPRKSAKTTSYWLKDLDSGKEQDLAIPYTEGGVTALNVFWNQNESQVFIEPSLSTINQPALYVSIDKQKISIRRVMDISPWNQLLSPAYIEFFILGVSPSGKYVLAQPGPSDMLAWVYDQQQVTDLGFNVIGNRQVAWATEDTFIAITSDGVVRYNIPQKAKTVLVGAKDIVAASLSPNGSFTMSALSSYNDYGVQAGVVRCRVS